MDTNAALYGDLERILVTREEIAEAVKRLGKKLTEDYFKDLIVISYNEVESNVELQSVGMVTA